MTIVSDESGIVGMTALGGWEGVIETGQSVR